MNGRTGPYDPVTIGAIFIGMCIAGSIIIRLLNLHLPRPRNFREFVMATFWVYPAEFDKQRIFYNKVAWLIVAFVTYVIISSVF